VANGIDLSMDYASSRGELRNWKLHPSFSRQASDHEQAALIRQSRHMGRVRDPSRTSWRQNPSTTVSPPNPRTHRQIGLRPDLEDSVHCKCGLRAFRRGTKASTNRTPTLKWTRLFNSSRPGRERLASQAEQNRRSRPCRTPITKSKP